MYKKYAILALAAVYLSACTTTDPYTGEQKVSNTAGGAAIGAGMGAVAGLLIGNNPVQRRNAALIGAGVGALAGGAIGNYMDNQESELRAQLEGTGVSVTRVGDRIVLNMPSGWVGAVTPLTSSSSRVDKLSRNRRRVTPDPSRWRG